MNKKIIIPVIVVIILLAAGFIYIRKSAEASVPAPTATPAATETPEAAATPVPSAAPTPTATPSNVEETEEVVDKDSPEYIKKKYNQEGKTLTPILEEEGCYVDEDGVIRYSDGIPVTFDDPTSYSEGTVYIENPEDDPNLMTEEEQQATKDANDGKNAELNAVIDQLYKEGYFN